MAPRAFGRAVRGALLGAALAAAGSLAADEGPFEEGTHYHRLPVPVATAADAVTVTEFFSYACGHCFQFDPELDHWAEGTAEDVVLERVPAAFSPLYELLAEAYYVARACKVLPVTHTPLFRALHLERKPLRSQEAIARFFADKVDETPVPGASCTTEEDFLKTFKSFGVRSAINQSKSRAKAYQARGVPALIIDGAFRTDGQSAGSNEGMLQVADALIEKRRAEKASTP
ncbi:MAG: thiol:disulfide interchange protein DsbA/DsbL [Pseudomonadales bacterium]